MPNTEIQIVSEPVHVIEIGVLELRGNGLGPPGTSINGSLFISDVTPQSAGENVGSKTLTADGKAMMSCVSTTNAVRVHVLAITGHSSYTPVVSVNNVPVTLTETADKSIFTGIVDLNLSAGGLIYAIHSDGPTWETLVTTDTPPVVTAAVFYGGYPGTQTELKENDSFGLWVTADVDFVAYEIADYGALKYKSASMNATTFFDAVGTIANRGNTAQALGFRVRVQSPTGAWSEWFDSDSVGTADALQTVVLNNLCPVITFGDITYPIGQLALKDSEQATVLVTANNFDAIVFSSSQLAVEDANAYSAIKTVTRINGDYNLSNNLFAQVNRIANDSMATASAAIYIAHIAPIVSVATPAARLRSGGNAGTIAQNHTITLTANQQLLNAPTLTAPEAILSDVWTGAGTTWHTTLQVHDDHAKGVFDWAAVSATNLAGKSVGVISSGQQYTLGGFVFRVLIVPAFPTRQVAIGTVVVDTAKLRCTNLSKGASGSLNFTYQATTDEAVDRYTVLTENTWYNCDGANASSNTTGTMQIELEEIV